MKTTVGIFLKTELWTDIKPENILLDGQNGIRLCDFGMTKFLNDKDNATCQLGGTTEYCAPEQIQFDPLTPSADMWSIGCCAYVLLSKTSPFRREEVHETQNAVIEVDYDFEDNIWKTRSNSSKDFIRQLLVKNPKVNILKLRTLR